MHVKLLFVKIARFFKCVCNNHCGRGGVSTTKQSGSHECRSVLKWLLGEDA